MRVEEGKVTADITDTALQVVLQELAERTGLIFEVRSQDKPPFPYTCSMFLQEAIQRIASGNNAIFLDGQGEESTKLTSSANFSPTSPVPTACYSFTWVPVRLQRTTMT